MCISNCPSSGKMKTSIKAVCVLLITQFIYTNGYEIEDFATVEDDSNSVVDDVEIPALENTRTGRILWPYPYINNYTAPFQSNKGNEPGKTKEDQLDSLRQKRFLWSYPNNPLMDIMMQTVAVNHSPKNPQDPFDFLRDSYPLPKGNCLKYTMFYS